jgi:hypothetical protein
MQTLKTGKALAAVCAAAELSPESIALLAGDVAVPAFVKRLLEEQNFADAVAFLAHALPSREGVWWAWLCARDAAGQTPPPAVSRSLDAIRTWIAEPTDAHRRSALDVAQPAGFTTPVGCAALAVFLTGDTLGPATAPAAPPGEFAAAKAIAGSVHLAAVVDPNADVPAGYTEFVERGLELAERIQLWGPPPAAGARSSGEVR